MIPCWCTSIKKWCLHEAFLNYPVRVCHLFSVEKSNWYQEYSQEGNLKIKILGFGGLHILLAHVIPLAGWGDTE